MGSLKQSPWKCCNFGVADLIGLSDTPPATLRDVTDRS